MMRSIRISIFVLFSILCVSVWSVEKPRVLLMGESRVQQFSPYACDSLQEYTVKCKCMGNGAYDYLFGTDPKWGDRLLDRWGKIFEFNPDILYFTYGLDEINFMIEMTPEERAREDLELHDQMVAFVDSIREILPHTLLLFHNQLPIDQMGKERQPEDVVWANDYTENIADSLGIPIHDQYQLTFDEGLPRKDARHYYEEGKLMQGNWAAEFILSQWQKSVNIPNQKNFPRYRKNVLFLPTIQKQGWFDLNGSRTNGDHNFQIIVNRQN